MLARVSLQLTRPTIRIASALFSKPTRGVIFRMQSTADPRTAFQQPPFEGEKEQPKPGLEQRMTTKPDHGEDTYVGHGRLNGKKAIVTGADSGIGRAVALAYAREGADVCVSYMPEEEADAQETRRLVEGAGRKCIMVPVDFTKGKDECKRIVDRAVEAFGRIDVLVNNASMQGKAKTEGTIEEMDYERVYNTFRVNMFPYFEVTRLAVPHMSPGSSIINTSSIQAFKPVRLSMRVCFLPLHPSVFPPRMLINPPTRRPPTSPPHRPLRSWTTPAPKVPWSRSPRAWPWT